MLTNNPIHVTHAVRRFSAPANVGVLQRRARVTLVLIALVLLAVVGLIARSLVASIPLAFEIIAGVAAVIVLAWVWRQPVRGVYILFAAAVVQETTYSAYQYPDDLGAYAPFFQDISTWTHVKGVSFSIAEVFMALVLLIWLLKGIAARNLRFNKGTLMLPLGLYMLMVLVGELHGIASGGNVTLSLWEVRGQVYMFVAYLLACNLVKSRREINTLVWIVLLGGGIKGIQGVVRYFLVLGGSLHGAESLFPHEQAFFYNAFLTLTPILFLYGGSRRLKRVALVLLPLVLVADIANNRRAGVLAFGVGLVMLLIITVFVYAPRRRLVVALLCLGAVIWIPYYNIYKTKSGLLAEPARAVYSNSHPDPRDASSNLYRDNENADLKYTMKLTLTNRVIGFGFGKPFYTPYALANISNVYIFWNLLPHNSVLWVWMRMGTAGYILFWLLIGGAIMQGVRLARRLREPYLKGLAVFITAMVVQEVIFGYTDLQWTSDRNLITIGVLFALLTKLGTFAGPEEPTAAELYWPWDRRRWIKPITPRIPKADRVIPARAAQAVQPFERQAPSW